ncbi:hypothetical protein DWY69_25825 [Eisenbergiella massiliensis]|uniref:Uncharacterized protein n=1 Tax=Eisenbergiella massiliensis TaxID=1720294 RepID=A0A3E3IEZ1_9FIRM|nr:hypothetical protein DWY69_25825 [Eisenbergiella massiliensis]
MLYPGRNFQTVANGAAYSNQRPRSKQRGIKLAALQSSGVFDPRGSRQISMQAWLLGSLLAGIKRACTNCSLINAPSILPFPQTVPIF